MKKSNKLFVAQLIILSILAASCSGEKKDVTAKVESDPLVRVEKVFARDVDQTREFTATVQANIVNKIAPQSPARIEAINVEVGDRVHKGQKLAEMDDNNLRQTKLQLENARIEFSRVDELYKIGGVSKSDWDQAKMNFDVLESSFKNLATNTQLLSPIDGIITARNYDKGDMYSQNPILVVEQISPVKLIINVSEAYYKFVKKGMTADIKLDVFGNENFGGKVSLVHPTIDSNTRTFPVEITINNQDRRVRPGMFARATLNFGTINNIVVPDQAVIKQSGSADRFIYILQQDGTVKYQKVELGRLMESAFEVISGIENGDQVVVAGQSRLINGTKVQVEKK